MTEVAVKRKRKICVITGSRAEYGLLYWLLREIEEDEQLVLQLIATGTHLSHEFGYTHKEIEKDFVITRKIETLLSSDSPVGVSKAMGLAQISFAEAYDDLQPDIVVVLGDRFEIFAAVSAAMVCRIPVAHLHGGESSEGVIDEAIRHSITKMSHLHFVSTDEYKRRVIQLGEHPGRVFNVGAMGIDNIKKLTLLDKSELEEKIQFRFNKKNILVAFHPVTLEKNTSSKHFQELLDVLDELQDTNVIFTYSNADVDGRIINKMIDEYVGINVGRAVSFVSLGQLLYLSVLKCMDAIVGNSSSGLLEAPSFGIGTINIGDRQAARVKADSVIDCAPKKGEILKGFAKLYSDAFQGKVKNVVNPHGNGGASFQVKTVLKETHLANILKKSFFNIAF